MCAQNIGSLDFRTSLRAGELLNKNSYLTKIDRLLLHIYTEAHTQYLNNYFGLHTDCT